MPEPPLSEHDYLRRIELLAIDVANHAMAEGWLNGDADHATPLRRSIDELARRLRHYHFDGDGCLDDDRPTLRLAGASLILPGESGVSDSYRTRCGELGIAARADGWALWQTWDNRERSCTIVTSAVAATRGLLDNWSRGRDVHPVRPYQAEIAAVLTGWVGTFVLSPGRAVEVGLDGQK